MRFLITFIFLLHFFASKSQRVGVVLSGGGSGGAAHIGVLKALESNHVPIDFIAGTSMGALVGGLYAAGYTPGEIEGIILSEDFNQMVEGKIDEKFIFLFHEPEPNSSWIGLKFRVDSSFRFKFPTNLVSPLNIDYALMEYTAPASAAAGNNFDSLFIPFRCVSADIYNKKEVVFSSGDLGQALRASTTYPFYFKPVSIDNKLLFDGGLYNNFPADIMYQDFLPDIIIGSTVVNEISPPKDDDIYSQIKNMIMERTSYSEICDKEHMLIIRPAIPKTGILDFSKSAEMIDAGYKETILRLDRIKKMIPRNEDSASLSNKRVAFRKKMNPLSISEIRINGLNKKQTLFVSRVIGKNQNIVSSESLKKAYFRLGLDERISAIYPRAERIDNSAGYRMNLDMRIDKDLYAQFGGVFSSRPINTGFVAITYKRLGRFGFKADANAYFGKFYSSAKINPVLDFPFVFPFLLEGDFTINNFNYFKSASTFFEDTRPSYLIDYERSFSGSMGIPVTQHSRLKMGYTQGRIINDYYQTNNFISVDTADRTKFNNKSGWLHFEIFNQNRRQYANTGIHFNLKLKYFEGNEFYLPGSTSAKDKKIENIYDFYRITVSYDQYFKIGGPFRLGLYGEGIFSNQPFLANYTATILQAPAFNPVPESRTLFLPNFRAFNYVSGGVRFITSFTERIDLRVEGYLFQPFKEIIRQTDQSAAYGNLFQNRYAMASAAVVFSTPVTPLAVSLNYYQNAEKPFSLLFTLGYLIFNKKSME